MKAFNFAYRLFLTIAAGISEVFASIFLSLVIMESPLAKYVEGAIEKIQSFLFSLASGDYGIGIIGSWLKAFFSAISQGFNSLANWMLICIAIWGIFRALMAIHGGGAFKALHNSYEEFIDETKEKTYSSKPNKPISIKEWAKRKGEEWSKSKKAGPAEQINICSSIKTST